ncbi:hypothetical protein C8F01DRAFT_1374108 [Mycena amicta]|nr:hypothetical protein C8F01DRAFT_1374108 [Mycena amicta]
MNDPGLEQPIQSSYDNAANKIKDELHWHGRERPGVTAGRGGGGSRLFSAQSMVVHVDDVSVNRWDVWTSRSLGESVFRMEAVLKIRHSMLNAITGLSLAFSLIANVLLLANFGHVVRYSLAQSFTIVLWYLSSILLIIPLGMTYTTPSRLSAPQDTSSHTHALTIEALVGGADHLVAHVGSAANPSAIAAQLLRVHETWPQDVWARTGRVQLASAFLASLVSGKWMPMAEAEACATGLWSHTANAWDEKVLDIVGGSREEGRRVRGWLGEVDLTGGGRRAGNISRYLVERYGFDPETGVTSFTSDGLAAYLSMVPSSNDVVIQFGLMDVLMAPAQHYLPTRLYNLFPHPAQDSTEKRRYIAVVTNRNADVPRALVRDMYTKSWSAFDRLVAIVPPGGSIGLDDKLFAFWYLQGDAHPFAHVKGIYRFETGIKVTEFRDLRANPRCLLESQILALRVKFAKILATGVLARGPPPPLSVHAARRSTAGALGVTFDPYNTVPFPGRILATGAAANFPSVANLVCDVFNAPVFVPTTQIASAQAAPHRNAPAFGCPSRGSLGAAPGVIGMTPSSSSSSGISMASVSTAFTTPDLGASGTSGMLSPGIIGANGTAGAGTPTTPTPLTPVAALPTSEAELQLGLAKVAEPDSDAFLAYAAIVPEYCRLEGMLVKGIV